MRGPYSRFISDIFCKWSSGLIPASFLISARVLQAKQRPSRFTKFTLPHGLHFSRAIHTWPKCVVDNPQCCETLPFKKRQEYFPHQLYSFVSVFGCFWHVLDGKEDCRCRMLILGQGLLVIYCILMQINFHFPLAKQQEVKLETFLEAHGFEDVSDSKITGCLWKDSIYPIHVAAKLGEPLISAGVNAVLYT